MGHMYKQHKNVKKFKQKANIYDIIRLVILNWMQMQ